MNEAAKQAALERAIEDKDSLVLFYQPIHDVRTKKIVAAEALLRQRRESGEIREAAAISEGAETASSSDLFDLDHWTTEMALRAAAGWSARGASDVRLNVNLSPREFQEGKVIPRLTRLLGGCGVSPQNINLEITESSYIDCPEETMDILQSLKRLGINLWLDDFGTGHSTLEHLLRFPVDGLKIPKPYIDGVVRDARSAIIVRSLIRLAHDLGMGVIAEGVEHGEQLSFLRDAGCDAIQGFLFSRPMPVQELEKLL